MASRKGKKKKKGPTPPQTRQPRLAVGAVVRVRAGMIDVNYPDLPLGGWVGTMEEVESAAPRPTYLVAWNAATLAQMPEIYRKRCERDGNECERYWLWEEDLEPYDGASVVLEQPGEIVTRPLDPNDQDDRIRAILGLTS